MRRFLLAVGLLTAMCLTGCGGGGGSGGNSGATKTENSQGLYKGVTNTGTDVTLYILDDGRFYEFYSQGVYRLGGVILGNFIENNGTLASANDTIDLNVLGDGVQDVNIQGNYVPRTSVDLTVNGPPAISLSSDPMIKFMNSPPSGQL